MAASGFAESLLGGIEPGLKRVLTELVRYVLPNSRFGPVDHQTKSESFQAYYVNSTTATSTGEFNVVHGMGRTPYVALLAMDLGSSATAFPVIRNARPADGQRVYLRADAGSTNTPFTLLLE